MTDKMKLYIGLLALGLALIGGGLWLHFNSPAHKVPTPEGSPAITMNVAHIMGGEFSYLTIYEDGTVIYIEEKGLRMPTWDNPPTRTWKTGKLREEGLDSLLEFIKDNGFKELKVSYKFPGKPIEGGGFTMGDMGCTIYVDYGYLHKKVSAFGYLTPDHGMTYPDMPYPLNEIYKRLKHIAENRTEEVARESI